MPKNKCLKSQKDGHEKHVVEAKELSSTGAKEQSPCLIKDPSLPAKPKDEIDEIFASKKKRKSEQREEKQLEQLQDENTSVKPKRAKKKKKESGLGGDEPSRRPIRKTNDGFTIYSAEELGINKADAGGTPLCPFDCSCCF